MSDERHYPPELFLKRILFSVVLILISVSSVWAFEQKAGLPVEVNGDSVDYLTEQNKITTEGNVIVVYGVSTLTCDKITVNTLSKEGYATGHVVLKDDKGSTLDGEEAFYNFDTKLGKIIKAHITSTPYYGWSSTIEKFPTKYVLRNAKLTTCNLDNPHYYLRAREIEIYPNDKLKARGVTLVAGASTPIMYLPFFEQSLKEKRNCFSVTPGYSKRWGAFLLSGTRFYIGENAKGIVRLDYRQNKGFGWGTDLEFQSPQYGNGVFRYYQVNEKLQPNGVELPLFKESQRYKIEYRHFWDIDETNHFTMEVNNYSDNEFLKNYFYRQFEKDNQPRSYMLFTHNFPNATLSTLMDKRINHFYNDIEKLPEVKLDTINQKILETPFYYQNQSSISSLTNRIAYAEPGSDVVRADTFNKLSYPFKLSFLNLNPYVGERNTFYSRDLTGDKDESLLRAAFYSGISLLTKFYRTFNAEADSHGLEIHGLRHIITPSINYDYIHQPTVGTARLAQFDEIDAVAAQSKVTPSLENRLQTKRNGQTVDFVRFLVENPYDLRIEKSKGHFEDMHMQLDTLPNSWLRLLAESHFDYQRHAFRDASFNASISPDKNTTFSGEYRYATVAGGSINTKGNSKLMTFTFDHQLNPKWHIRTYQRIELAALSTGNSPFEEQEIALSRDLHCWIMDFSFNTRKKQGGTFWIAFRLKAFPELGFDMENWTPLR